MDSEKICEAAPMKKKRERKHVTGRKCWCKTIRIRPWPKREKVLFRGWTYSDDNWYGTNNRLIVKDRPRNMGGGMLVRVKVVVEE